MLKNGESKTPVHTHRLRLSECACTCLSCNGSASSSDGFNVCWFFIFPVGLWQWRSAAVLLNPFALGLVLVLLHTSSPFSHLITHPCLKEISSMRHSSCTRTCVVSCRVTQVLPQNWTIQIKKERKVWKKKIWVY